MGSTAVEYWCEACARFCHVAGFLSGVQLLLMSIHIFWDNMEFCTHPSVALFGGAGPSWLSFEVANRRQKNWRALSDSVGLCAAWLLQRRLRTCKTGVAELSTPQVAVRIKEARYATFKLLFDVLTYLPQTTWVGIARWFAQIGYHDGYIGIMGSLASLLSCRAEWIKCVNMVTFPQK